MNSTVENAIGDSLKAGKALCKFISRNDVGANRSHQCGFYLPKSAWQTFTNHPPKQGENYKSTVKILWPEGIETESSVTWYGQGTRSEYRLTRFGRDFPWLIEGVVGSLLVIIPFSLTYFKAYILQTEDEIELFQAVLGVDTLGGWGLYVGGQARLESEDECLKRVFDSTTSSLSEFPDGNWMASQARIGVDACINNIKQSNPDDRLLKWVAAEYQLFRSLEKRLCLPSIQKGFSQIDEFISVAATIMNRRKSRAGHSLEHHVETILKDEQLTFESQPRIDGKIKPDILIPGKAAYENLKFPVSKLIVVGIKTTCKDRWRQILNEGKRIPEKHLFTLQPAISRDQLIEMREANVTLIVPKPYHKGYDLQTGIRLLSVDDFIGKIKSLNY